ncbi:MAG: hypothetical protein MUF21_06925 [Gemmatimonadaceae bacterium]|nr:hypothetical protein [Gemmatimonadaceae bacterium]
MPFDLSEVLFIATSNFIQNIPGPLIDRMEVVDFSGYTEREKLEIAKTYLIPRQLEESGLAKRELTFDDDAIMAVISRYTRESGVRQLERQLGAVARKIARRIAAGDESVLADTRVDAAEVRELLGRPKVHPEHAQASNEVGIATGMYYTPMGGDIMFVESSIRRRDGHRRGEDTQAADAARDASGAGPMALILTGQLGDVMKESARAALTFATNNGAALGIPSERMRGMAEAHIHVPAGAIPKDGPSAGIAIATALVSEMSGVPVRRDVAMTGEITLRGRVLPIGGVKEKVLGAHRAGITTVIVPKDNEADLEDVPAARRSRRRWSSSRGCERGRRAQRASSRSCTSGRDDALEREGTRGNDVLSTTAHAEGFACAVVVRGDQRRIGSMRRSSALWASMASRATWPERVYTGVTTTPVASPPPMVIGTM